MPTFEEWRDAAFSVIEEVRQRLDPDEDWSPVILFDAGERGGLISLVGIEGTEGLPVVNAALQKIQPQKINRIEMGWLATHIEGDTTAPSERPDRVETLILQSAEAGPGGQHEMWMSQVQRHEDGPPTLEGWEKMDACAGPVAETTKLMMQTMGRMN